MHKINEKKEENLLIAKNVDEKTEGEKNINIAANIFSKSFKFMNIFLAILLIFMLTVIVYVNLKYSVTLRIAKEIDTNIIIRESRETIFYVSIAIAILIAFNILMLGIFKRISPKISKILNICILVILAISNLTLLIIWNKISYEKNLIDSFQVLLGAVEAPELKSLSLWYFIKFPWQIGLLGYEMIIVKLFNFKTVDEAEAAFKNINMIYILSSSVIIYMLTKRYIISKIKDVKFKELVINSGIIFLNLPIIMLVGFVYGDLPTIFYSLIAISLILRALDKKKYGLIYIAAIPMFIAIMVRQNSMIILIAIAIILLMEIIKLFFKMDNYSPNNEITKKNEKLKKFTLVFATLIFVFGTVAVKQVITNIVVDRFQYKDEKIESVPLKNHIAIGISEGGSAPGWYNKDVSKHSYYYNKINHKFYSKFFKKRLEKFKSDPSYMMRFFEKKLAATWAEPTYNAVHYNTHYRHTKEENPKGYTYNKFLKEKIKENEIISSLYYGENRKRLEVFAKTLLLTAVFSSIYYILYKLVTRKEFSRMETLFMLIFIGGFIYHLLSEIKARYVMIYTFMLFPFAYSGISIMINNIYNISSKIKKRRLKEVSKKEI